MSPRASNRGRDFATGKPVDLSKPEEPVRQDFEHVLVQSYGYPRMKLIFV